MKTYIIFSRHREVSPLLSGQRSDLFQEADCFSRPGRARNDGLPVTEETLKNRGHAFPPDPDSYREAISPPKAQRNGGLKKSAFAALILLLIAFSGCRKNVTVKLPEYTEKLVVEASIETGQPAQVLLSVTAPYFGNVDLTDPTQFFVKGAFVTVSDGSLVDTLIEPLPATGYYYTGTKVFGQVGKTYFLTIRANGKTYTATTSILNPIALDSVYTKHEKDTLGFCWGHLTDPPGVGNCYRWFAKRLTQDQFFAAPFNSAFDDKFVDGKSFDFGYERPPQPDKHEEYNAEPENSRGYYRVGDTIVVKFCTIGIPEYLFWRSYYDNKSSNGNPFSAPSNLRNTIQGDAAIGAFCGYSTTFDTLIFKPK